MPSSIRAVVLLSLLLMATLIVACDTDGNDSVRGSGELEARSFPLSGFTELDIGSSFEVKATAGTEFAVVVEADDNIINDLVVEVRGERLVLRAGSGFSFRNATLRAEVTVPDLVRIEASGASSVDLFGFESRWTASSICRARAAWKAPSTPWSWRSTFLGRAVPSCRAS